MWVQQQLQRTEKVDNSFIAITPETFLLIEAYLTVNCKTTERQKISEISARIVLYMFIFFY